MISFEKCNKKFAKDAYYNLLSPEGILKILPTHTHVHPPSHTQAHPLIPMHTHAYPPPAHTHKWHLLCTFALFVTCKKEIVGVWIFWINQQIKKLALNLHKDMNIIITIETVNRYSKAYFKNINFETKKLISNLNDKQYAISYFALFLVR